VNSVLSAVTGHATILLAVAAILEGVLAAWLFRRNDEMRMRLRRARDAADEAARTAALAAPGGIDPEIVIHLLRSGQSVTLDVVHSLMEERETADVAADPGEP
jgi:predicted kinase